MRNTLLLILAISMTPIAYAASATYKYDSSGKLISIQYDDGSEITYSYDNQGNMTTSTSSKKDPSDLSWLPTILELLLDD
ncbi:RHS repeat domain-containing protein [Acinetobacter baumannii]|nr:RHS repeat domain-containing protein [Acinetobacter baumannii]HEM8710283.1 RHS repeat protein [Acinetobacter baumannii]